MNAKLIAALLTLAAGSAAAQEATDVTPANYHFNTAAALPVSAQLTTGANLAANNWANVSAEWNDGLLVLAGGQYANTASPYNTAAKEMQQKIQLVNLGGTVGKVMCFATKDCDINDVLTAASGDNQYAYNIPVMENAHQWGNFNFYLSPSTPAKAAGNLRVTITYNVYEPTGTAAGNFVNKVYLTSNQNNAQPAADATPNTPFAFSDCRTDGAYDPTKWIEYQFDTYAIAGADSPMRIKMEFTGAGHKGCLFIKDITVQHLPGANDAVAGGVRNYNAVQYAIGNPKETTSVDNAVAAQSLSVSVNGSAVTVSHAARVYSVSGTKVASLQAGQSQQLAPGLYVATSAAGSVKFAI